MLRPLRMVGLDLSTAATGIAATHDPDGNPFPHVFTVPGTAKRPLHEQVEVITRAVRRACGWGPAGAVWQPDLVVIEDTFSGHGPADYPLHALHGCVRQAVWRRRIPYALVTNGSVKLWATGSGATSGANKVTKDKVIAAIIGNYGRHITINPRDDNQADAVALLTLGLHKYGQPLGDFTPSIPQQRPLKSVAWPTLDLGAAA